ncbi:YsnF/AvaK domain-containing protein [Kitasatospora sp. NPDC059722]|uniref:YsnF/AvaK domain-containing protein n=1 Tax=unclassified Kitasatospora TaxID=2633591 RepID=UPI00365D8393
MTTTTLTTAPTTTATEAHVRTLSTPAPTAAPMAAATTTAQPPVAQPAVQPKPQAAPATEAPSAPSGPVEITCREERLDITTEWHVLGTAKLRKYVTSEQVERRVPVVRERVRVERMPVGDAERAALTEKEIAEAVEEVTLREERPVVRKYLAPIERVRLVVERYTAEEVIHDELRRENVEVHDDTPATPNGAPNGTPTPNGASLRPLS